MYRDLTESWKCRRMSFLPATEEEVAAWEARKNVQLPAEFRAYLREVGGPGTCIEDPEMFSFYPLDQLFLWTEVEWALQTGAALPPDPQHFIIFADYLQICYGYAVRFAGPLNRIGEVVFVGGSHRKAITDSFRTFIGLYLADDQRLHIAD